MRFLAHVHVLTVLALWPSAPMPLAGADVDWAAVAAAVRALPSAPRGHEVLDRLERRARDVLAAIEHPRDAAGLARTAPALRQRLRAALGVERLPRPLPRDARTVGVVDGGDHVIEKLVWETFPGTPVPAHLYRPPGAARGRLPAVLFVPGHWWADSKSRPDFQAFCINMARLGFVVLTYDPIGQGERGVSTRDHRRTPSLLAGISQEGIVVFESLCALEYLLSRGEVDPARVGITGASGGGYNSWMVTALDDRIAVSVPVVGTSEFLEQISVCRTLDWYHAKEHCHFVSGLLRFANNHELLALAAPRPVLVISAHGDQSFPIAGIRKVVEYGRGLYGALGKPERIASFEDATTGHGYQRPKREAAYGWFQRWLGGEGDGLPITEPPTATRAYDDPALRCFPPGENRGAGPGIIAYLRGLTREVTERHIPFAAARRLLVETLGVPDTAPPAGAPALRREGRSAAAGGVSVERVSWTAPDGLAVPAALIAPAGPWRGAVLCASDGGRDALLERPHVRAAVEAGLAVVLADVRGTGELAIDAPGWAFAVSLLLGESFVARQAVDLVAGARALAAAAELGGRSITLLGSGPSASLAALYAAVIEPSVGALALDGGFSSYRDFIERPRSIERSYALGGPEETGKVALDREIPHEIVPFDVLRRFDLPDLVATLAPRPILVTAAIDGDWDVAAPADAGAVRSFVSTLVPARIAGIAASHWTRDAEFEPKNAIDGNAATKWVGEGHPLTQQPTNVVVELEGPVVVGRLVLVSAVHRDRLALKDFEVYAWTDGGWAGGAPLAVVRHASEVRTTVTLAPAPTRRLRIRIRDTHRDDHAFPRLHEIEVFPAAPGTAPVALEASLLPDESKSEDVLLRRAMGEKIVFPGVTFEPEKGYLHYLRAFLDTMIAEGTDRYGSQHGPMFVSLLDMTTHENPRQTPANVEGQRSGDRAPHGGNLFHDVMLLRACDLVSDLTGEEKYRRAATAYLEFFLEHCPQPTGLWPWGEHAHWEFYREAPGHRTHEHLGGVPVEFWERAWAIDAGAVRGEADGLINHVVDLETFDFDRHADIMGPLPEPRPPGLGFLDFPRHAGFYVGLWSFAHGRTGDERYLDWARKIVDHHWRSRDDAGGLPLACTVTDRRNTISVSSALSLSVSLLEAAGRTSDADAAARFREVARSFVDRILALPHRPREGMLVVAFPAGAPARAETCEFSVPYRYGYGGGFSADDGLLLLAAHRHAGDPRALAIARGLGTFYAASEPPPAWEVVRAHVYASILGLFLDLHDLTGEKEWLEQAERHARLAIERLFHGGLFRGATGIDHYEADLMVGNLAYNLAWLHAATSGAAADVPPNYFNR